MGGLGQIFSAISELRSLSCPNTGKYGQNRKNNCTILIFFTTHRLVMSLNLRSLLTGLEPVFR
jgi:hypothetical protein